MGQDSQRDCTRGATALRSICGQRWQTFRIGFPKFYVNVPRAKLFLAYSAFIQRSLLMSKTAGDFEMPEMSNTGQLLQREIASRPVLSLRLQPRSAT